MIADRAIYRDGQRIAAPKSLAELNAAYRGGDGLAWIGLHRPDAAEFGAVAAAAGPGLRRRSLRDVEDHALRIEEPVSGFRELLQNIVSVNLTLETKALSGAANPTNEEVKKISAWAAIFFAPTLIGTIYGMNFRDMPELRWADGYPFALGLMALMCVGLYVMFKRRGI